MERIRARSKANKGKHLTENAKKRLPEFNEREHLSKGTKKRIFEGLKGRVCFEETKNKISESEKGLIWIEGDSNIRGDAEMVIKIIDIAMNVDYVHVFPETSELFRWFYS